MSNKWLVLLVGLAFLIGCASPDPDNVSDVATDLPPTAVTVPPTFTPRSPTDQLFASRPVVTVTQPVIPTEPTPTQIPFGETTVELRYTIPALNLERRLQGSISSQIILVDETSEEAIQRTNQAGVLFELQQSLPSMQLGPVPEGCDGCVQVAYNLPFAQQQAQGWLKDRVLLASIENYLALTLGPHFPPGTVVGLRRSASAYAPAHTIAVTADGLLYRWLATENEVDAPQTAVSDFNAALNEIDLSSLTDQYAAACPGVTPETLFLRQGEETREIVIGCPEYALPATLVPLYAMLDAAMNEKLAASDNTLERPPAVFPLTAVIDYQRFDGARLTIDRDGTVVAEDAVQRSNSMILSAGDVISLTASLLQSGELHLGLTSFAVAPTPTGTIQATATPVPRSLLLVRGNDGVYDANWIGTANVPVLLPLNALLNELLGQETGDATAVPTESSLTSTVPALTETPTPNPDE